MRLTWKREWIWILIVILSLRVLYSALGIMAISDGLPEALGANESLSAAEAPLHTDGFSQALVNVWMRRDTAWYLKSAVNGYSSTSTGKLQPLFIAAFPGLPGVWRD